MLAINPEYCLLCGESDEAVVVIVWTTRIIVKKEVFPILSQRILVCNDFSFPGETCTVSFPDESDSGFLISQQMPCLRRVTVCCHPYLPYPIMCYDIYCDRTGVSLLIDG